MLYVLGGREEFSASIWEFGATTSPDALGPPAGGVRIAVDLSRVREYPFRDVAAVLLQRLDVLDDARAPRARPMRSG